jgi:hypothetical protein
MFRCLCHGSLSLLIVSVDCASPMHCLGYWNISQLAFHHIDVRPSETGSGRWYPFAMHIN